MLYAEGDLAGARANLERSLAIETKIHGSRDHTVVALTETTLSKVLFELGEAATSRQLLAHTYQVFLRELGPDHPYTRRLAPLFQD